MSGTRDFQCEETLNATIVAFACAGNIEQLEVFLLQYGEKIPFALQGFLQGHHFEFHLRSKGFALIDNIKDAGLRQKLLTALIGSEKFSNEMCEALKARYMRDEPTLAAHSFFAPTPIEQALADEADHAIQLKITP